MGDQWFLTIALEAGGITLRLARLCEQGTYLLGADTALRTALPFPPGVAEREPLQQHIISLQGALGLTAFQESWTAGATDPLERVARSATVSLESIAQAAIA
jgi:hypothetical protein